MTNKKYISGRKREYEIKHFLENKGFECFRTSGSHGSADIIAISKSHIYLIQSKKGKLSNNKKEIIKSMMPQEGYTYIKSLVVDDSWKQDLGEL